MLLWQWYTMWWNSSDDCSAFRRGKCATRFRHTNLDWGFFFRIKVFRAIDAWELSIRSQRSQMRTLRFKFASAHIQRRMCIIKLNITFWNAIQLVVIKIIITEKKCFVVLRRRLVITSRSVYSAGIKRDAKRVRIFIKRVGFCACLYFHWSRALYSRFSLLFQGKSVIFSVALRIRRAFYEQIVWRCSLDVPRKYLLFLAMPPLRIIRRSRGSHTECTSTSYQRYI